MTNLQNKIIEDISRDGRSVLCVFPPANSTDFVNDAFQYTIGNALVGFPELLIVGLYTDTWIVNTLSRKMIERGRKFDDGEVVDLGGKCPVCVIDATDAVKERYTLLVEHVVKQYEVQQVVLSDPQGRFPWQAGCDAPYSKVAVHRKATRH